MNDTTCGDYAGYQRHIRRREPPCGPCREANREYTADYRAKNSAVLTRQHRQAALRRRALSRLAELYPSDYRRLLSEVVVDDRATQRRTGATT